MPNANWSNPTLTSTYTNFVTEVKNRDEDLALQFDGTTSTNLVTNTIRWDSAANRWKKWNGSSWAELTGTYALTGLSTTGGATIGTTLGVTGAATLSSTLGVTGAITGSSTVSGTALIPTAATVPANGVFLPAASTVGVATGSTERFRVNAAGTTLFGTQTALTNAYAIGSALTPALQIEGNTANGAALSITRQTSAAANLLLQRGVAGTPVVDTDAVGQVNFNGFDGTNYFNAALIRAAVDGTPGTGSMPGRLSFQTTPTGSTTPVERLRLDPAGQILAASLGTAALPVWSFTGDPNTGAWSPGADTFAVSTGGVERVKFGNTEVVFNDSGADVDFRVEGDTNANLFKIDAGTDQVQVANLNGGQLAGTRNRIICGSMAIDQRNAGASQTFTAAAALAYSVDRWYGYCTGANVTGQQITGATAGQFRYQFTGAASVTAIGFGQRIERLNSADLASTTATLSVDLANSLLTSVTWTAYYATTADTFGTLAAPTRTQIATGTFTVSSTVTRYSTNISVPAAATTGIEIVFTVGAQTSGTWTIGAVQLEPGSVATPFEYRSYGQELALCQRYYVTGTTAPALNPLGTTANISSTTCFPVQMRGTPTVTTTGLVVSYQNTLNFTGFSNTAGSSWSGGNNTFTASVEL